jgi:hypothetical protein
MRDDSSFPVADGERTTRDLPAAPEAGRGVAAGGGRRSGGQARGWWMAVQIFSGVRGMSRWRTP